jgi:hypothetical protein|nr:MAG TPA: hypothetical protein [Caudoviricetes sp.]
MPKFNIGELLIFKGKERQRIDLLTALEQVTDIQNGQYFLSDYGAIDIEQAEKEYIRVADALWQHYIIDSTTSRLVPYNGPMTIKKANDLFAPSKTNNKKLITAYWEGFRLPEEPEPKIDYKFFTADVLLHRELAGEPIVSRDLLVIEKVDVINNLYIFTNGTSKPIVEVDTKYINVFDDTTLWYFEYQLDDGCWIIPQDTMRKSYSEVSNTDYVMCNGTSHKVVDTHILYGQGFTVKELPNG